MPPRFHLLASRAAGSLWLRRVTLGGAQDASRARRFAASFFLRQDDDGASRTFAVVLAGDVALQAVYFLSERRFVPQAVGSVHAGLSALRDFEALVVDARRTLATSGGLTGFAGLFWGRRRIFWSRPVPQRGHWASRRPELSRRPIGCLLAGLGCASVFLAGHLGSADCCVLLALPGGPTLLAGRWDSLSFCLAGCPYFPSRAFARAGSTGYPHGLFGRAGSVSSAFADGARR